MKYFIRILLYFATFFLFLFWSDSINYGNIGNENKKISSFIQNLISKDEKVFYKARQELIKIGPTAISNLIQFSKTKEMQNSYKEKIESAISGIILTLFSYGNCCYDTDISEKTIDEIIDYYSKEMGQYSVLVLGNLKSKKVLPVLLKMLKDENIRTRESAARGIGQIGEIESIESLEEMRNSSESIDVMAVHYAIKMIWIKNKLKSLTIKEKINLLKVLLEYETDDYLKREIYWELARINDKRIIPILFDHNLDFDGIHGEYIAPAIELCVMSMPEETIIELEKRNFSFRKGIIAELEYFGSFQESFLFLEQYAKETENKEIKNEITKALKRIKEEKIEQFYLKRIK